MHTIIKKLTEVQSLFFASFLDKVTAIEGRWADSVAAGTHYIQIIKDITERAHNVLPTATNGDLCVEKCTVNFQFLKTHTVTFSSS